MMTSPTCSVSSAVASGSRPESVMTTSASGSAAIVLMPDHAPLGVVGDDGQPAGRAGQGPVGLCLQQVGAGEPGALVHAVHAEEDQVEVERPQRRHGHRADQGVRRRADAAGEHDGLVRVAATGRRRSAICTELVTTVMPRHVEQPVREGPGGGAGRQPDRAARAHQLGRHAGRWRPSRRARGPTWPRSRARRCWCVRGPWRPPCTLSSSPWPASTSRSRRTVMSETSRARVRSLTRTAPRSRTRSRM